ncbi:AAA family ATPase [Psychrobacter sp. Pi2-51]|uniref:AAA family ATPase n=1 Tax=Psychrobacter sp. Pi2-51 TaxID=2774132 RepID=UPI00191A5D4E|nr:AAA family ATPase [Psychrobacter sp. Pi2-51]
MIESFQVKNIATYNESGISCNDLGKINFIYGTNGSGKTTLSNLLRTRSPNCTIRWLSDRPLDIHVYNKDFKEKNILNNASLNGVFTIGEDDIDNEKLILKKQNEVEGLEKVSFGLGKSLADKKKDLLDLKKEVVDAVWFDSGELRKNALKSPLSGYLGKKEDFFAKSLIELGGTAALLDLKELEEQSETLYGKAPSSLPKIISPSSGLDQVENNDIWKEIIVGKGDINISALIESLNISSWVREGSTYLQDNVETCPFCQKDTIDHNFREDIHSYFDNNYTIKENLLKSLQNTYTSYSDKLLNSFQQIADAHKVKTSYAFDSVSFERFMAQLRTKIQLNINLIASKLEKPNRVIDIDVTMTEIGQLQKIINEANSLIDKQNALVSRLGASKAELVRNSWRYIAELNKDNLKKYNRESKNANSAIRSINERLATTEANIKKINREIAQLSQKKTNTKKTIDDINSSLSYFGFTGFSIVESPDSNKHYQLKRNDGSIANETLSEGEVSFITFLYFYHLCKGGSTESTINSNRVIVIDDPISSLDSNILFVVSSLVKDIIYDINNDSNHKIKQLIVLTHNVYFHKEISYTSNKLKASCRANFWNLRKVGNVTSIKNYYNKNPIKSSYELLWQELREDSTSQTTLQNSMRRIIENYFKILGGIEDNDILACFSCTHEQLICRSLICWVNDGSHCIPDDLYVDDQSSTIDEYKRIFKDIFKHTNHLAHYEMMVREK